MQYSANGFSLTYSLSHELSTTTMLISMAAKGNTRAIILPFGLDKSRIIWDPDGSILLHRLGGKPNLKERGMSGYGHGFMGRPACASQPAQGRHYGALQKQQEPEGKLDGIFRKQRLSSFSRIPLLVTVLLLPLEPYPSSAISLILFSPFNPATSC